MKPLILVLLTAVAASAHHSFDAEFDRSKPVSLSGVVTKVEWTNPHVWFWINVKDESTGKLVNWGCEMGSPNALQRTGWTVATMKEGMIVSLTGLCTTGALYGFPLCSLVPVVQVDGPFCFASLLRLIAR